MPAAQESSARRPRPRSRAPGSSSSAAAAWRPATATRRCWRSIRGARYRRLLVDDEGRLAGAILLGDLRDAKALRQLLSDRDRVPDSLFEGFPEAPAGDADAGDPSANVCSCQGVSRDEIREAIASRGLTTVAHVAEHTRATTGCGGCRPEVETLLRPLAGVGGPRAA